MAELQNAQGHGPDDTELVSLSDYLGQPLVLESLGHRKQSTRMGESDVVACLMHVWTGSELEFKGEVLCFWEKVKQKLDAQGSTPLAGVIRKGNRAYFIDPVDDATFEKMAAALAAAMETEANTKF